MVAAPIRAHENRKLGFDVVRVRISAYHAQSFGLTLLVVRDRYKRHGALVIDLRERGQLMRGYFPNEAEKARA
jgi:hypothetical protein